MPKKRSFWRGLLVSLAIHYATVIGCVAAFILIRPLLWEVLFGRIGWASTGPVDPNSGEGTVLQIVGLLTFIPAGYAALHWSGSKGWLSLLALIAYVVAVSLLGALFNPPPPMSVGRALWYWSSGPWGVLIGAALFTFRAKRASPVVEVSSGGA